MTLPGLASATSNDSSDPKAPITLETLNDTLITLTLALKKTQTSQENNIDCIEKKLHKVLKKSDDLSNTIAVTIATKFTSINQSVHLNKTLAEKNASDISDLKDSLDFQANQLLEREKEIKPN
jgi:hypothetical protein